VRRERRRERDGEREKELRLFLNAAAERFVSPKILAHMSKRQSSV